MRVDAQQAADVRYWAERFQCSGAQLRAAVSMVGNEVLRVQEHLTGQRYGAAFSDAGPGQPGDLRISITTEFEVRYWTRALGCTADNLRAAMFAVGPMMLAVRQRLRKNS